MLNAKHPDSEICPFLQCGNQHIDISLGYVRGSGAVQCHNLPAPHGKVLPIFESKLIFEFRIHIRTALEEECAALGTFNSIVFIKKVALEIRGSIGNTILEC